MVHHDRSDWPRARARSPRCSSLSHVSRWPPPPPGLLRVRVKELLAMWWSLSMASREPLFSPQCFTEGPRHGKPQSMDDLVAHAPRLGFSYKLTIIYYKRVPVRGLALARIGCSVTLRFRTLGPITQGRMCGVPPANLARRSALHD